MGVPEAAALASRLRVEVGAQGGGGVGSPRASGGSGLGTGAARGCTGRLDLGREGCSSSSGRESEAHPAALWASPSGDAWAILSAFAESVAGFVFCVSGLLLNQMLCFSQGF